MKKTITICLIIVGLINLAPVIGVVSTQKLELAYSVTLAGNDLALLMRHRALLFGILGTFILYSAFKPQFQPAAMLMAGASMIGFAALLLSEGGYNESLAKVLAGDVVGIVVLLAAVVLKYVVKVKQHDQPV